MTKEELLLMIKAGYSKAEIEALTAEEPAEEQKPEAPEDAPAEVTPPETPTPAGELDELKKQFADMSKELSNIVKGLQAANLANARQGEPSKNTVDDILKDMLNPSRGGK